MDTACCSGAAGAASPMDTACSPLWCRRRCQPRFCCCQRCSCRLKLTCCSICGAQRSMGWHAPWRAACCYSRRLGHSGGRGGQGPPSSGGSARCGCWGSGTCHTVPRQGRPALLQLQQRALQYPTALRLKASCLHQSLEAAQLRWLGPLLGWLLPLMPQMLLVVPLLLLLLLLLPLLLLLWRRLSVGAGAVAAAGRDGRRCRHLWGDGRRAHGAWRPRVGRQILRPLHRGHPERGAAAAEQHLGCVRWSARSVQRSVRQRRQQGIL